MIQWFEFNHRSPVTPDHRAIIKPGVLQHRLNPLVAQNALQRQHGQAGVE